MKSLIDLLSYLYDDSREIRVLAEAAELSVAHIDFNASAHLVWYSILREARLQRALGKIIEQVRERYPYYYQEEELEEARKLYEAKSPNVRARAFAEPSAFKVVDRRPANGLPPGYQAIHFVDSNSPAGEAKTLTELIVEYKSEEDLPTCIVAHFQQDVEAALQEFDETFMLSETSEGLERRTVWIRGEQMLLSGIPEGSAPHPDSPIVRLLCPRSDSPDQFANDFDLQMDAMEWLFLVDFSRLSLNDLFAPDASKMNGILDQAVQAFETFVKRARSQDNHVVIGLPRFALGRREWREFFDNSPNSLMADDLFSIKGNTSTSSHAEFLDIPLPPKIEEIIHSLLPANSHAFTTEMLKSAKRLGDRFRGRSPAADEQLREIVNLGSRLYNDNFLEPAFRIEAWLRTKDQGDTILSMQAEIRSFSGDKSGVCGMLQSALDLPKVSNRVILTGESGQGKLTTLRQLEHYWQLPRRMMQGRNCPVWLPILIEETPAIDRIWTVQLRRAETVELSAATSQVQLRAHTQFNRLVTSENIYWLFSSPVLLLFSGLMNVTDETVPNAWMSEILRYSPRSTGMVVAYGAIDLTPLTQPWFARVFGTAVEARLRPLELEDASRLCSSDRAKQVKSAYYRVGEPLNDHLRNTFLVHCLNHIDPALRLPPSCSLMELIDLYVRSRIGPNLSDSALDAVEEHLPRFAYTNNTDNTLSLPPEARGVGIRCGILTGTEPLRFTVSILADYFLARYLIKHWAEVGSTFMAEIPPLRKQSWESLKLNLFQIMVKGLRTEQRTELIGMLRSRGYLHFAHRCLLELTPDQYHADPMASEMGAEIASQLEGPIFVGWATVQDSDRWKFQCDAAHALGRYDPRLPNEMDWQKGFVRLKTPDDSVLFAGRYPVTNLEFSRFIESEGYSQAEYWHPAGWSWLQANRIEAPAHWGTFHRSRPNCPVVGVSFYEAIAYANWLTSHLGLNVGYEGAFGLPTPSEWMQFSPQGDGDNMLLNIIQRENEEDFTISLPGDPTHILQQWVRSNPTYSGGYPVGMFPPYEGGLNDLYGNVWQWCDAWFFGDADELLPSQNGSQTVPPVLMRGGPAESPARSFISLFGGGLDPFSRADNVGFRLIYRATQSRPIAGE